MDSIMKSRFLSLYQMVLADGIVDAAEMETLFRIGKENYGIESQEINELIRDTDFSTLLPSNLDDKVRLLYELGEIAWADGHIDDSEKNLLKKYVVSMGFEEANAPEIVDFILQQVKERVTIEDVLKMIKQ